MGKKEYAIIKLKYGDGYFPVICQSVFKIDEFLESFNPFAGDYVYVGNPVYKDIITGKKLIFSKYDSSWHARRAGLTYVDYVRDGEKTIQLFEKITAEKALKLIKQLNPEQIDNYIIILNEIENQQIKQHKEMLDKYRDKRRQEEEDFDINFRGRF